MTTACAIVQGHAYGLVGVAFICGMAVAGLAWAWWG